MPNNTTLTAFTDSELQEDPEPTEHQRQNKRQTQPKQLSSGPLHDSSSKVPASQAMSDDKSPEPPQHETPNQDEAKESWGGNLGVTDDVIAVLIENQMVGLLEAIRELIQNGTDSPSSTKVLCSVTPDKTVVIDDGDGLDLSDESGESHVTEFGKTSKPSRDNSTIGEMGLGKGPSFAVGAVRIHSRDREIFFDYKDRFNHGGFQYAAGYKWHNAPAEHDLDGFLVEIYHYEEETESISSQLDADSLAADLRKEVRFRPYTSGRDIIINGQHAAPSGRHPEEYTSQDTPSRTIEIDDAIITYDASKKSHRVYSNGIFVKDVEVSNTPVGGTILTTQNLRLTFSRREIKDQCPLWTRIKAETEEKFEKAFDADEVENWSSNDKKFFAKTLSRSKEARDRYSDYKLFRRIDGALSSVADLRNAKTIAITGNATEAAVAACNSSKLILDKSDDASHTFFRKCFGVFQSKPDDFESVRVVKKIRNLSLGEDMGSGTIEKDGLRPTQRRKLQFAQALIREANLPFYTVEYGEETDEGPFPGHVTSSGNITITDGDTTSVSRVVWMHELTVALSQYIAFDGDSRLAGELSSAHMQESAHLLSNDLMDAYRAIAKPITTEGFDSVFDKYGV